MREMTREQLLEENSRMREILRRGIIHEDERGYWCLACAGESWAEGDPERHLPGCLADLNPERQG
jgi:hypothetical protein